MIYKTELVKHLLSYMLPFYVGACLSKFESVRNMIYQNKWIRALSMLVWIATMCLYYSTPDAGIASKLSRLTCGIVSIAVFFPLFSQVSSKMGKIDRIMEIVGVNTMGIFFMHFLIVRHIPLPLEWNCFLVGLIVLVVSAIVISVSVLISRMLQRSSITSMLLLGK